MRARMNTKREKKTIVEKKKGKRDEKEAKSSRPRGEKTRTEGGEGDMTYIFKQRQTPDLLRRNLSYDENSGFTTRQKTIVFRFNFGIMHSFSILSFIFFFFKQRLGIDIISMN